MQTGKVIIGFLGVLALFAPLLRGQTPPTDSRAALAGDIFREIDDPSTGDRWLLLPDSKHPGGPGLLLRAGSDQAHSNPVRLGTAKPGVAAPAPVIRAGDRIVVEENTPLVASRLEAVAMGPALVGAALSVRLRMGGRVLRAVAVASGRARIQEETQP